MHKGSQVAQPSSLGSQHPEPFLRMLSGHKGYLCRGPAICGSQTAASRDSPEPRSPRSPGMCGALSKKGQGPSRTQPLCQIVMAGTLLPPDGGRPLGSWPPAVHALPSTLMIHTPPPPHTAVHTPLSTGPPSIPHHPHPIIHTPPSTPYCPHAHHLHTHCPHPSIHIPPSRSQSPHPTVHTPQVQSLVRELKSHMLLRQNTNMRWDECDSNQDCPAPNSGSSAKP